jgi:hypothetical protein
MKILTKIFPCLLLFSPVCLAESTRALILDGDGDYVEVADSDELSITSPITIEFLIKCNSYPAGAEAFIVGRHTAAPQDQSYYATVSPQGDLRFSIKGSGGATLTITGTTCSTTQVQRVAFTYNGNTMRAFVNGQEAGTLNTSVAVRSTIGGVLGIGADIDPIDANQFFNGWLDDVRIWNRTLTQVEIQENSSKVFTGSEPGLIGFWNFKNGTAMDSSSSGNHGVFHGDAHTALIENDSNMVIGLNVNMDRAVYYEIESSNDETYQLFGRDSPSDFIWHEIGAPVLGTGDTIYGFERGAGLPWLPARAWNITDNTDGYSLQFDGTGDFAFRAHDSLLNLPSGMTLEAWVKPGASGTVGTIIAKAASPSIASYRLGMNATGQATFLVYESSGGSWELTHSGD